MFKMIDELNALLVEQKELEQKLEKVRAEITNQCRELTAEELETCDYETLRKLYNAVHYRLDEEQNHIFSDILATKKTEIYPQMLKPTYYPEIDQLDITDSEKLRLDKAARNNVRYYMTEKNISRLLEYPMSIDDLELLTTIGVAEKMYNFKCPNCDDPCKVISQKDLESHKEVWRLMELMKEKGLTKEQEQQLETLEEDGYGYIYLDCLDDEDFEDEICDRAAFERYEKSLETVYKIKKSPDLTYEKL